MKNPYGIIDGKLVTVYEVERGLSSGCVCPACGHRLQAHKGKIKAPYFSHYRGSDCGVGYETALHILAKEILLKEKKILLPELKVTSDISIAIEDTYLEKEIIVKPWTIVELDSVELERKIDRIIPDVILKKRDRTLLVEIKVTHGIDDKNLEYVKNENLNMIEYDFSKIKGVIDEEHIKNVLTKSYKGAKKGHGRGVWINHHLMDSTKEALNERYISKNLKTIID